MSLDTHRLVKHMMMVKEKKCYRILSLNTYTNKYLDAYTLNGNGYFKYKMSLKDDYSSLLVAGRTTNEPLFSVFSLITAISFNQ